MNLYLPAIAMLLVVSCSKETSRIGELVEKRAQPLSKNKSYIEPVPTQLEKNPFVFQSHVTKAKANPWQNWKLLGTFSVDAKARSALLSNPDGKNYIFSNKSELPEPGWSVADIKSQHITFVSADGFFHSIRSKQK